MSLNSLYSSIGRRAIAVVVLLCFGLTGVKVPAVCAQELVLPKPGTMVSLSPAFAPAVLKGLKVHPDNPFRFDFILDKGDGYFADDQLKEESNKLIKYFLASLTVPEQDLWVNLSPYEKDRIVPQSFGQTEMGRDLLAQDYLLKQITASLIYPEDEFGKKFWNRIYEEAQKKLNTTNIPVNTFNKVWIVPEKAVVYENAQAGTAYVVESKLKVMLEQDYLALSNAVIPAKAGIQDTSALGSQIVREIVIPQLTKEINENKNFAQLRQVYNSLILATWYKKKIKSSILNQVYADQNKVKGTEYKDSVIPTSSTVIPAKAGIQDKGDVEGIYQQYLQAFKKGVYNYIKEEQDPITQQIIPKKYFSGGVNLDFAMNGQSDLKTGKLMKIVSWVSDAVVSNAQGLYRAAVDLKPFGEMGGREELSEKLVLPNLPDLPDGTSVAHIIRSKEIIGEDGKSGSVAYAVRNPQQNGNVSNMEAAEIFEQLELFEQANSRVLTLLNADELTAGHAKTLLSALRHMVVVYLKLFKNFPKEKDWSDEQVILEAMGYSQADVKNIARIYHNIEQSINAEIEMAGAAQSLSSNVLEGMRRLDEIKSADMTLRGAESYSPSDIHGVSFHELINIVHQKGLKNLDNVFESLSGEKSQIMVEMSGVEVSGGSGRKILSHAKEKIIWATTPSEDVFVNQQFDKMVKGLDKGIYQPAIVPISPIASGALESLLKQMVSEDSQEIKQKFLAMVPTLLLLAKQGSGDAILALAWSYTDLNHEVGEQFLEFIKDEIKHIDSPAWKSIVKAAVFLMQNLSLGDYDKQLLYKMLREYIMMKGIDDQKKTVFGVVTMDFWVYLKKHYSDDFTFYHADLMKNIQYPESINALAAIPSSYLGTHSQDTIDELIAKHIKNPFPGASSIFINYLKTRLTETDLIKKQVDEGNFSHGDKVALQWAVYQDEEADQGEAETAILSHLTDSGEEAQEGQAAYWQLVLPAIAGAWNKFHNADIRRKISDEIFKHVDLKTPGSLEAFAIMTRSPRFKKEYLIKVDMKPDQAMTSEEWTDKVKKVGLKEGLEGHKLPYIKELIENTVNKEALEWHEFQHVKELVKDKINMGLSGTMEDRLEGETAKTGVFNGFKLGFYDARRQPTQQMPLPMRYVSLAFTLGQGLHKNYRMFPPERAKIIADDKHAWISMKLGLHSATIIFTLKPLQDGGGITVSYTDSGPNYVPGSNIRVNALARAFKQEGFRVDVKGHRLEAQFDKETKINGIDQLPEKLHFIVQALSGTLDLDVRLNSTLRSNQYDEDQITGSLADTLVRQGFWHRQGEKSGVVNEASVKYSLNEQEKESIKKDAEALGISVTDDDINLRLLQTIERRKDLLRQRGTVVETSDGWSVAPQYRQAVQVSPITYLLQRMSNADEASLRMAKRMAAIARTAKTYASDIRMLGTLGNYQVQQITVNALEDKINFYLLSDLRDGEPVLAFAVLGDFFYDSPRNDVLRHKRMPNNALSLSDVGEILNLNGINAGDVTMPEAVQASSGTIKKDGWMAILRNFRFFPRFLANRMMGDDPLSVVSNIDWESLRKPPAEPLTFSPIFVEGKPVYPDVVLGRAVFKQEGRQPSELSDGVLFADVTDNKDDELIRAALGVVVTQGGPQAHAAIRSKEFRKAGLILNQAEYGAGRIGLKVIKGDVRQRTETVLGRKVFIKEYTDYGVKDLFIEEGDIIYLDSRSGRLFLLAKHDDVQAQGVWGQYRQWCLSPRVETLTALLNLSGAESLVKAIINDVLIHARLDINQIEQLLSLLVRNPQLKNMVVPFLSQRGKEAVAKFQSAKHKLERSLESLSSIEQILLDVNGFMVEAEHAKKLLVLMNGDRTDIMDPSDIDRDIHNLMNSARIILANYRRLLMERSNDQERWDDLKYLVDLDHKFKLTGSSLQEANPSTFLKLQELIKDRNQRLQERFGREPIIWKDEIGDAIEGTMALGNIRGGVRDMAGGKGAQSAEIINALRKLKEAGFIPRGVDVVNPLGFAINPDNYQQWDQAGQVDRIPESLTVPLKQAYERLFSRQIDDIKRLIKSDQRTIGRSAEEILRILEENASDMGLLKLKIGEYLQNLTRQNSVSKSLYNRLLALGVVAVRSSGLTEDNLETAGAGKYKTVLGVAGFEQLMDAVVHVWRSGAEGVLIEEMINAKQSLLVFSANDIEQDMTQVRIDAVEGLAVGLVEQVVKDPDSYLIRKEIEGESSSILERHRHKGEKKERVVLNGELNGITVEYINSASKYALNDDQILLATHVVQCLEAYFNMPLDIEASFDADNRLVILQARPITTLSLSLRKGLEFLDQKANQAQLSEVDQNKGGIDLNADKIDSAMTVQNSGGEIKFNIDPAMLAQLQNVPGFVPVIINIQPMTDVRMWLSRSASDKTLQS